MGAFCVVVPPPLLDDDFRVTQRVEYLPVKEFVPKLGVEALAISVLPRRAGFDVGRMRSDCGNPVAHRLG